MEIRRKNRDFNTLYRFRRCQEKRFITGGKTKTKTQTKRTETYCFSELSEEAKKTALQEYIETELYRDWNDFVLEDAKEVEKILGIWIDNIYWSGFSS